MALARRKLPGITPMRARWTFRTVESHSRAQCTEAPCAPGIFSYRHIGDGLEETICEETTNSRTTPSGPIVMPPAMISSFCAALASGSTRLLWAAQGEAHIFGV